MFRKRSLFATRETLIQKAIGLLEIKELNDGRTSVSNGAREIVLSHAEQGAVLPYGTERERAARMATLLRRLVGMLEIAVIDKGWMGWQPALRGRHGTIMLEPWDSDELWAILDDHPVALEPAVMTAGTPLWPAPLALLAVLVGLPLVGAVSWWQALMSLFALAAVTAGLAALLSVGSMTSGPARKAWQRIRRAKPRPGAQG